MKKLLSLLLIVPLIFGACNKTSQDNNKTTQPAPNVVNRAVLVGINDYPKAPLNGCVNDVFNTKKELIDSKRFKPDEITVLINEGATKENIVAALTRMVNEVTPGGKAYFHYSGHGTQVPATNDLSEIDGLYECICPVDFGFTENGEAVNGITDKDFVQLFSKFKTGVIFCWSSDSCHSGDLDRKVTPLLKKIRAFPIPAKVAEKLRIARNENPKSKILKALTDGVLDVGFLSGCRSDQTSADASFGGIPEGAFTHYFLETLREKPTSSLNTIASTMRTKMRNNGFEQRPQAEGTRAGKSFLAP